MGAPLVLFLFAFMSRACLEWCVGVMVCALGDVEFIGECGKITIYGYT